MKLTLGMTLIDGKSVAQDIKAEIAAEVASMVAAGYRRPRLAALLVGDNTASETYVANKVKACGECGFESMVARMDADVSELDVLAVINDFNNNPEIDGFIVQLPLPAHISEQRVIEAVDYRKDVDGFNPVNVGLQSIGAECFHSATPSGILELIRRYEIPTEGRRCVIVGRSNIVGKPLASMMMQKNYPGNATVTVCHSATVGLDEICRQADILISATGKPGLITGDMVREGATVIDVGINRVADASRKTGYRLTGDVDFASVAPKCSFITPVPGGVGPMTVSMLMKNTLKAARLWRRSEEIN